MGDDWDPFAVDEEPAIGGPQPLGSSTGDKAKAGGNRISAADQERLANDIFELMKEDAPWGRPANMKADQMFNQPTCDSYDWRHKDVKFEIGAGIGYVIFNRPNENNSMQDTLGHGLTDALLALHKRPDLRVAVFSGEGRMYCAGGDPKSWQAAALMAKGVKMDGDGTVGHRIPGKTPTEECMKHMQMILMRAEASGAFGDKKWHEIEFSRVGAAKQWQCWSTLPQFTIALVNGSAMGGGVGAVCCCDYVISVKKAYFVVSEVKIGVIPATISPYVVAKIGPANAKRLFNTGESMKAERAKEVGIVNEVVENMAAGHLRVKAMADMIVPCAPGAVAAIKNLVFTVAGQPILDPIMFFTALKAKENLASEESKIGRSCEIESKKKPWELSPIVPLY